MLIAYPGGETQKAELVAELVRHAEIDAATGERSLTQSYGYWKDGKGCSVGCAMVSLGHADDAGNHALLGELTGYGEALEMLNDAIFEGLPPDLAMQWPSRFKEAAKPGADLSLVVWRFKHFAVSLAPGRENPLVKHAIDAVLDLLARAGRGETVSDEDWSAAASAAWSAWSAWSAASSAAWGAAESAAWGAAWGAARSAARSAASSAAWSAAWSAESAARGAISAAWSKMADHLIELIEAAPTVESAQ